MGWFEPGTFARRAEPLSTWPHPANYLCLNILVYDSFIRFICQSVFLFMSFILLSNLFSRYLLIFQQSNFFFFIFPSYQAIITLFLLFFKYYQHHQRLQITSTSSNSIDLTAGSSPRLNHEPLPFTDRYVTIRDFATPSLFSFSEPERVTSAMFDGSDPTTQSRERIVFRAFYKFADHIFTRKH